MKGVPRIIDLRYAVQTGNPYCDVIFMTVLVHSRNQWAHSFRVKRNQTLDFSPRCCYDHKLQTEKCWHRIQSKTYLCTICGGFKCLILCICFWLYVLARSTNPHGSQWRMWRQRSRLYHSLLVFFLYFLIVSVGCRMCINFMFHTCQCIADNIDSSFLGCDYLHNFDLSHLCFSLVLLAVAYGNEFIIILKV